MAERIRSRAIIATVLVVALGALGITGARAAEIIGWVRQWDGRTPIPGAMVIMPKRALTTTADSSGRFVLGRVPAGRCSLYVRAGGLIEPAWQICDLRGIADTETVSVYLHAIEQHRGHLEVESERAARKRLAEAAAALRSGTTAILGWLTDGEQDAPVRGADVSVRPLDLVTMTDHSGRFELRHLPAGRCTLVVSLRGVRDRPLLPLEIRAVPDTDTVRIRIRIPGPRPTLYFPPRALAARSPDGSTRHSAAEWDADSTVTVRVRVVDASDGCTPPGGTVSIGNQTDDIGVGPAGEYVFRTFPDVDMSLSASARGYCSTSRVVHTPARVDADTLVVLPIHRCVNEPDRFPPERRAPWR